MEVELLRSNAIEINQLVKQKIIGITHKLAQADDSNDREKYLKECLNMLFLHHDKLESVLETLEPARAQTPQAPSAGYLIKITLISSLISSLTASVILKLLI